MDEYSHMNYNYYPQGPEMFQNVPEDPQMLAPKANEPPPPPPIVICPTEVDHINVTLEKFQQCACKDCGKLFNSVWYLKQHAVKHSNDRPFKCRYCHKTYKFRSNLYQHKCPDRQKSIAAGGRRGGHIISPSARRLETNQLLKSRIEANMQAEEMNQNQTVCLSDNEDNDAPITYGLVIQNIDQSQLSMQQSMHYNMQQYAPQPLMHPQEMENHDYDSVRGQQLPPKQIEEFVSKNKNKIFTCRKCRALMPTEESLLRHMASHSAEDLFPYKCANCRQAFETQKELRRHSLAHSEVGPFKCDECCGQFRSSYALRRHKDQCRPCFVPPLQNNIMVSANSPFDPYSFIPAENEHFFMPICEEIARSGDSGIGSEGSPNSCSDASPPHRQSMTAEDAFDIIGEHKKAKEDDEDSGFRSRLNSVTQSCSPDSSSFSSHSGSPHRKLSGQDPADVNSPFGAYGTGPTYGQQMYFEQSVGGLGDMNTYSLVDGVMEMKQMIAFKTNEASNVVIAPAPIIAFGPAQKLSKEMFMEFAGLTLNDSLNELGMVNDEHWKFGKESNDFYLQDDEIAKYIAFWMVIFALIACKIYATTLTNLAKLISLCEKLN